MLQLEKIKLIIWDLDETLWDGILSEEQITIPEQNRLLITRLADIGIVNSICSKNDYYQVVKALEQNEIDKWFVFSSVNWESKGPRVKGIISDMKLRPQNVLFLDDNPSNREEVRFFCPGIMTDGPEGIPLLAEQAWAAETKDPEHKRLEQYKVLEKKIEKKSSFSSNEEFLLDSRIQVEIGYDCQKHTDRIYDLIQRANQLNFTKIRSTKEELEELFEDSSYETGYASVRDKYGDYGIVGFYAVKKGRLEHFVFSCRTLGMGIEQYVYHRLGCPELIVVGEVVGDVITSENPGWINQNTGNKDAEKMEVQNLKEHMVLIKGPCDLFQIYPYIKNTELFDTDFSRTTAQGVYIESTSHTSHLVEAYRLTEERKNLIVKEAPFMDKEVYSDKMYTHPYKVVIISILTDFNLGVYRRKESGELLAFVEYVQPITEKHNWDGLLSGKLRTNNFPFTREILNDFSNKYEFIGRNTPEQTLANIQFIRQHLPKDCLLIVMLGGELYYEKNAFKAYEDRHIIHKQANDLLREYAQKTDGIRLLDVNKYLVDQNSFYDHFNHYTKPVYYNLAGEMVEMINSHTGFTLRETAKSKMLMVRLKEMLAPAYHRLKRLVLKPKMLNRKST